MSRTLLLNATYEPLAVVPLHRAVLLVLKEKAEVVELAGGELRAERVSIPIPSVIRLTRFVRIPLRARVPLTRTAVLSRDAGRCAYCGGRASTIDHVLPRSRGGLHRWENVVAACGPCNSRKDDRLLGELGWELPFKPSVPMGRTWLVIGVARLDPVWEPYLAGAVAVT